MTYSAVYCALITKRLQNPLPDDEYGEVHHIIPKSEGGTNDKDNLVRLSAREHFIAHLLLAKIYNDFKMWCAIKRLVHGNKKHYTRVNSRTYSLIKKRYSSCPHPSKGIKLPPRSKSWCEAISRGKKGIPSPRKGKPCLSNIGKKWWHLGDKNFFGFECPGDGWIPGCYQKPELRANGGKAIVGMVWWNNGVVEVKRRTQPEGFVRGRL